MSVLANVITELKSLIASTFGLSNPATGASQVLTTVEIAQMSFQQAMSSGQLVAPVYVISIGNMEPDDDWGVDAWEVRRLPATIYGIYKFLPLGKSQSEVFDDLLTLANAIDNPITTHTNFKPIEPATINADVESPINQELFAQAQDRLLTASASWSPGFLVFANG